MRRTKKIKPDKQHEEAAEQLLVQNRAEDAWFMPREDAWQMEQDPAVNELEER